MYTYINMLYSCTLLCIVNVTIPNLAFQLCLFLNLSLSGAQTLIVETKRLNYRGLDKEEYLMIIMG